MEQTPTLLQQIKPFLPLLIPVVIIEIILLVVALLDLRKQAATRGGPKWMWALIIIFVNLIGPILYFILARKEE